MLEKSEALTVTKLVTARTKLYAFAAYAACSCEK